MQRRRSTLDKARQFATKTAKRLNEDGSRAEFLTAKDYRIYLLACRSIRSLQLEVDEVCRRYASLQARLKTGSLEDAVDFYNVHGQDIKTGVVTTELHEVYISDLEKRGADTYHLRDSKRYIGLFVQALLGPIDRLSDAEPRSLDWNRSAIAAFE